MAVKNVFWVSIGPFKVYLPPVNQLQGFLWHHYFLARVSGCLATDILCYNSLETRGNIHQIICLPIPTPPKLNAQGEVVIHVCCYGPWLPSNSRYLPSN